MGTRADFYIKKEKSMEYLGSIAWDGYEIDDNVLDATTEGEFRNELLRFFSTRDDVSTPQESGWPWPWNDSRTTDYSYVFENGKVWASNWGYKLYDPKIERTEEEEDDDTVKEDFWPDMEKHKCVRWDHKGSGILMFASKRAE